MLFAIHCLDKDGVLEKRMSVDQPPLCGPV